MNCPSNSLAFSSGSKIFVSPYTLFTYTWVWNICFLFLSLKKHSIVSTDSGINEYWTVSDVEGSYVLIWGAIPTYIHTYIKGLRTSTQSLKSGQWDSEPSFNTVLSSYEPEVLTVWPSCSVWLMGFMKTAAVKSTAPTSKSFVAFLTYVFRKLCSYVFITTVTETM